MTLSQRNTDWHFMSFAIAESHKSKPIESAYCVGAVLVNSNASPNNSIISTGFSREIEGNTHAEECCLLKLKSQNTPINQLNNLTMYTTMEPCSTRLSGKASCSHLIIQSKLISRVVIGALEPSVFVENCVGLKMLKEAGIIVDIFPGLEKECLDPNNHLLNKQQAQVK